jgi:CO/xanthine dehydrogenase FAD-binding subunit
MLMQVDSLEEAVKARSLLPDARWLAGGTSLIPDQNLGVFEPSGYISLRRIPELSRIEAQGDRLFVGAACTMATIFSQPAVTEFAPLLGKAAAILATRQIRSRATIGGNIATLRSDRSITPCLLALDAQVSVFNGSHMQEVSLEDYLNESLARSESALNEIVVGITLSRSHGFQDFSRIGLNNGAGYPIVVTALAIDFNTRTIHLGLGGGGPVACRAHEAETFAKTNMDWKSMTLSDPARFGEIAAGECHPRDDATSSSAYRRHAIKVMSKRLMEAATATQP